MRNSPKFATETELCERLCEWLVAKGWELYFEVDFGTIADIVARKDDLLWVIECKLTCSLDLIAQGIGRKPYADFVSIAFPERRTRWGGWVAVRAALSYAGVGALEVIPESTFGGGMIVKRKLDPVCQHRISDRLFDALNERQKTYAKPGNSDGARWSPYKNTCEQLLELVKGNEGIALKAAVEKIKHHYSSKASAENSLRTWIKEGKVAGVAGRIESRKFCLYFED